MTAAERLLAQAQPGELTAGQISKAEEIQQSGFSQALGGLGSILEFADRGRKLGMLALRDASGKDSYHRKEITGGDYWKVLAGKSSELVDTLGEDVVGRDGHLTFSNMMDDWWSHDDDDAWWDKALRGVASFGADVAFDPLTYVTFGSSAVGARGTALAVRKSISQAGDVALERAIAKRLGSQVDDIVETALERGFVADITSKGEVVAARLQKEAVEAGVMLPDKILVERAFSEAAGRNTGKIVKDAAEGVTRGSVDDAVKSAGMNTEKAFVDGVVGNKISEVTGIVTNRNFGTLRRTQADYLEHVFTRRNGSRLGEAITTGGMRFGLPFGTKVQSKPVRFTQGAFERWVGLKQLHKIPQSKLGAKVAQLTPFVDAQAPFIQAARRGLDNAPGQIRVDAMDWMNQVRMAAGHAARNDSGLTAAFRQADGLHTLMKKKGMSAEDQDTVWSLLFPSMQRGDVVPDVVRFGDDVVQQFAATVEGFHGLLDDSYQIIKRFSPQLQQMEDWVPLVFSREFHKAARVMREVGAPVGPDMEAAAARLSRVSGEEIDAQDVALFMEAYESLVGAASGAARVGDTASLHRRQMGRFLKSIDPGAHTRLAVLDTTSLSDEGVEFGAKRFADQAEMNETIVKVLRAVNEDKQYGLKLGDDASAFVTDPITLLNDYVAEVTSVAEQRAFLQAAKATGAARATTSEVNADHLMFLLGDVLPSVERRVRDMVENRGAVIEDIMSRPSKQVKVSYARNASVELPVEVAEHPAMKRVVARVRAQFVKLENKQRQFQRATELRVNEIVRKTGVDVADAERIATFGDEALATMRREYSDAVEEAYDEMYVALTRTWFETAADGRTADEMLDAATQQRAFLAKKAKETWRKIEDEYLTEMGYKVQHTKVESLHAILDVTDQAQYAATVEHLAAPIRKQMEEARQGVMQGLIDIDDELLERRNVVLRKLDEMGDDKNALHLKPEAGQNRKKLEAQLAALTDESDQINEVVEALASANAIDDDILVFSMMSVRRAEEQAEAAQLWGQWDGLIDAGIQNIAKTSERKAEQVAKLWAEYTEKVMTRQGTVATAELDQPRFWTALADGVFAEWDEYAAAMKAQPDLWAGYSHGDFGVITKREIIDNLQARVAALEENLNVFDRVEAVRVNNAKLDIKVRKSSPFRQEYDKVDLERIKQMAKIDGENPEAVMRQRLLDTVEELELVLDGDRYMTQVHIIAVMKGRMKAADARAGVAFRRQFKGLHVGDSLVSADRAFRTLASAPYDPQLAAQLPEALEIVNTQLRERPGGMFLRFNPEDGTLRLVSEEWVQDPIMPLRDMLDGVRAGTVTRQALDEHGLGFVSGFIEVDEALKAARLTAAKTRSSTMHSAKRAQVALEDFDDMMNIMDGVLNGRVTSEKLRRFVTEGSPHGKGVIESKAWKRIMSILPVEKQAQARRMVEAVMLSDARQTPKGRKLLAMSDEERWNRVLFRPLEESMGEVKTLSNDLAAQARAAATEEHAAFFVNAQEFLEQLTFVNQWRREVSPHGTALSQTARKVGPQGEQSLEDAIGTLTAYGKRLETDGPFKMQELIPGGDRNGAVVGMMEDQARIVKVRGDVRLEIEVRSQPAVVTQLGDSYTIHLRDGTWVGGLSIGGEAIAVAPDFRRAGVAGQLIQVAEEDGHNALKALADSTHTTKEMRAFLEANGIKLPKTAQTLKGRELGFTPAEIRKLYKGGGVFADAVERSGATLSQEGMTAAEAFSLGSHHRVHLEPADHAAERERFRRRHALL